MESKTSAASSRANFRAAVRQIQKLFALDVTSTLGRSNFATRVPEIFPRLILFPQKDVALY
jgi:hypothetical protein